MEKQTLEIDVNVFVDDGVHTAYDREYVEVHLQLFADDVFQSFPKEENFFGLENKRLTQVGFVSSNHGHMIDAVYTGGSDTIVTCPFKDSEGIQIKERDFEDHLKLIDGDRHIVWNNKHLGEIAEAFE